MRRLTRLAAPIGALALAAGLCVTAAPAVAAPAQTATQTGATETYLVLYKANGVSKSSLGAVAKAGGTVVQAYPQIGVAVVTSDRVGFGAAVKAADSAVQGAASTAAFGVAIEDEAAEAAADDRHSGTREDPLGAWQWDMDQIMAPEARAVNGGSSSVIVGDIDTGLDWSHPDLAANVDFDRSVSCVGGVPNQDPPRGWTTTATAPTLRAPSPPPRRSAWWALPEREDRRHQGGQPRRVLLPEAVVCSFMWAAEQGIQVTNNSYFADPWLFNCRRPRAAGDLGGRAPAIKFAQQSGTVIVAAEGNQSDVSPTAGVTRRTRVRCAPDACAVVPRRGAGRHRRDRNGAQQFKSYFSS